MVITIDMLSTPTLPLDPPFRNVISIAAISSVVATPAAKRSKLFSTYVVSEANGVIPVEA
ncbi:MAG: hypothetical protein AB1793_05305 [Candidatus Thermoplasmatota archaeon]